MVIEINQKELRQKLISIYKKYLSEDKKENQESKKDAMDADGLWSGSFIFPKEIETGIVNLRWLYIEPCLSSEKAKDILEKLQE